MKNKQIIRRKVRKLRIRSRIKEQERYPRIAVYRSNKNIYAQIIDDFSGKTLVSVSNSDLKDKKLAKIKIAHELGKLLAEKSKKVKLNKVIFDRGGFQYHGRIKALAEGAREGGLKF
jgi:large subunit ribosomal protein L18